MLTTSDLDALLRAIAKDSAYEDALIEELDRRYEEAKAAGTLPNTDAAFARFMAKWKGAAEDVAVVFRRYLMASGQSAADIVTRFHVSDGLVNDLMALREPFIAEDVETLAKRLAKESGNRVGAVNCVLKEVAAHHFARVSRTPLLLAARKRRP